MIVKMSKKRRNLLVELISALFILLFVYAAVSKIQDFEKFQVELGKSPILNAFSRFVATAIPFIEVSIALMLVIGKFQIIALYSSFTLMVMFSAYIIVILNFSSYVPCSCGGVLQNMTWTEHLFFNIGFVIMAAAAIILNPS